MKTFVSMPKMFMLTTAALLAVNTPGLAQVASSSGIGAGAGSTTFGTNTPFQNVTTSFDGISFNLRAVIKNPGNGTSLRLIATLKNSGAQEAEIFSFYPAATLIDELGNVYANSSISGISECRWNNRITDDLPTCAHSQNMPHASLLAPEVPIPISFIFTPAENQFEPELASMSETVTARLHFAYTLDGFENMVAKEVVIPNIPLPK